MPFMMHRFVGWPGRHVPAPDTAAAQAPAVEIGPLPSWDLSDLYPTTNSPRLGADLASIEVDATAFRDRYVGKLAALSGGELGTAVAEFERIEERLGRISSFAELTYAGDQSDAEIGRFFQTTQERLTAISSLTLFFTLELNRIEERDLNAKLAAPELKR